ncbi:cofilin, actophorin [Thelonectria olida]|uniref:Cofilin n=1 Tax=Thelonectria olida TaxID=1576542 RepID=A0A9P9AQ60_9HYPO|nr:cofilin, actophorin [Thelonectria olida]
MSIPSGVRIEDECISAVNQLRNRRGEDKPRFILFKISNDQKSVTVESVSSEKDYDVFLDKLSSAVDENGKAAPRYAVYDVEYDLGEEGKRIRTVFISWVPPETSIKSRMLYATTREQLNKALNLGLSIHADDLDDIEWSSVVHQVSRGRA